MAAIAHLFCSCPYPSPLLLPVAKLHLIVTFQSLFVFHYIDDLSLVDTFKTCAEAVSNAPDGGPNYYIKAVGSSSAAYTMCL